MKLTEIYNEFLVESIENLPEILAKGIEATSIEEMEDTLLVFGGTERIETSLPLFAYTLLKKGKTKSFEKLLDSLWQWDDPLPTIIMLMDGLGDYYLKDKEYTFQTVILPELQEMWSDLIVDGNKYYFDVLASDMKDFFSTDNWNGIDCSLIANEVFNEGFISDWEDYETNPNLEDLIMKGYIIDETYLKIIRHIGENYEGDIISNSREEFEGWVEDDEIIGLSPGEEHSFYLTRQRIDRYLDLEQRYDFLVLLDNSDEGLDEIKNIIKWSYNDAYNSAAQDDIVKIYEDELYDRLLSKPEHIDIQTYDDGHNPKKVTGYRFDVTSWLEEFVSEYFANEYYDEGGLLECILAYDYGGLGGLCPNVGEPYIDDTDERFIENYNDILQNQL
tara:strand:- start:1454 stop:2620 length:1167 start_codon:yes stop_codon:yes gene_type:complete